MPTIAEFDATSTPRREIHKIDHLIYKIANNYETSAAATTAITTLETLRGQWETVYNTELAAATIDSLPSSVSTQVTALQTTYTNYTA